MTKKDKMKVKIINWLIKVFKVDTNNISDGYHTFEDLYEHRIELWIALTKQLKSSKRVMVWKSDTHSDGSKWKGWFILGYGLKEGEQITYHLPEKYWDRIHIPFLDKAPNWDGHTDKDVIKRLQDL